jgi:hypothetical protein
MKILRKTLLYPKPTHYKSFFRTFSSIATQDKQINSIISKEIIKITSKYFKVSDVKIASAIQLSEPNRPNLVYKVGLESIETRIPSSLILKHFTSSTFDVNKQDILDRFNRDWVGLEFLDKHNINPRKFYGGSKENYFILMEDLGPKHISLVDFLTSKNVNIAKDSLERFMICLAQFHADCHDKVNEYEYLLHKSNTKPLNTHLKDTLEYMVKESKPILEQLGIIYSTTLHQEISSVIESMLTPGPFSTLVHGDMCPDNVFDLPNISKKEMRIIDFEWSFIGNALIDGVCLIMNMPTCWCAKSIPITLRKSLEKMYKDELSKKVSAAASDMYYKVYTDACAYWMLKSVVFINDILTEDCIVRSAKLPHDAFWYPEKNLLRPRTISALENFIDVSKDYNLLPNLRIMSEQLIKNLKTKWPEAKPLELYPVFDFDTKLDCNLIGETSLNDNNFLDC